MRLIDRLKIWSGIGPWTGSPGPPGGVMYPTSEGWISGSWGMNFGQLAYDPVKGGWNSVVYACIMRYANTIAQLPGYHQKALPDNGTETITNSALSRILKKPNAYQTRSDFMRNMVISLLAEGNAYAVGLRNDRNEITELHQFPATSCRALYGPPFDATTPIGEPGEIFYSVGGNPVLNYWQDPAYKDGMRWIIPARDILHFVGPSRPDDPLKGESPLVAGGLPIALSSGAGNQLAQYFANAARPSGVIETDLTLTKDQVAELRQRWDEQTRGAGAGGTPILTAGLKWNQVALTATDMQVAEQMKMSKEDIAMIFGVPLAMINDMTAATYNNVEQLIMVWLRMGLGYYVDQIELAFDQLFGIERGQEFTYLDINEALLRTDFKNRIEGLKNAVQGGIYSPNEARKIEGLPKAKDGDEPRVQQQVVPLTAWDLPPPSPPKPAATPAAAPEAEPAPPADEGKDIDPIGAFVTGRQRHVARGSIQ